MQLLPTPSAVRTSIGHCGKLAAVVVITMAAGCEDGRSGVPLHGAGLSSCGSVLRPCGEPCPPPGEVTTGFSPSFQGSAELLIAQCTQEDLQHVQVVVARSQVQAGTASLDQGSHGITVAHGSCPVEGCLVTLGLVWGNLSVLWLDLANAYGSIPHTLVQLTLTKHHVPSRCRDLIADYYSNFRTRVSSGAITSSWHKVEIGIITGCTISVTLFSLAMNMLTVS
ncbi:hypothetical protein N1851_018893 [Merluccius polli]|uniref:Reverse transcriptase domain-containing protein n=1 Tax=Merluccius polli TaxID=89951 RepID=A0AA47MMW3_MERPO|nr:hypothetical protein N1851_018893 [Merluccius polli]